MSSLCARLRHVCRTTTSRAESTPSRDLLSYSVAPTTVVPPSDHTKRAKYACEKCGTTFGRLDNLQHHVRSVCSSSISSSIIISSSSSSSSSSSVLNSVLTSPSRQHQRDQKIEYTTPPPTRYRGRSVEPPDRLPFSDTLSTELIDVVRAHLSAIRTHVSRGPL